MKNNITFVVFTYNEEKRIWYVVKNLINYWEVLIIDNFSSDNTINIAKELWANVYEFKNYWLIDTKEALEFIRPKVISEYMTWSCADWIWSKKLLEEIIKITREWKYDWISAIQKNYHYWLKILNFLTYRFFGKRFSKWGCVVIKKDLLYIDWLIHSNIKNKCTTIYEMPKEDDYMIHHLSVYNVKKFELWHSKYSDIESKMLYDAWTKSSLTKTFLKIIILFIKYYFLEWWWKSWKAWFIMIMQYMFFYFNVWAKHYELENNISLDTIENNYNKIREDLLKDI